MKQIVYKRKVPEVVEQTSDGERVIVREAYLQTERLCFTEATKELQIAEAMKYSYNGEYTIEDDGQPEPEPSREEKLEARVKALTETNAMLEECIVEMAAVVYA